MLKLKKKLLVAVSASDTLEQLGKKDKDGKTTIAELLEDFHENGFVLSMIFFALPIAVPLPYPPGFTTILGTPLMILAIQMLLGYDRVKLPKKFGDYQIKNSFLIMISQKTVPWLIKLEQFIKPRCEFAKSVYCEQFVGLMSFICAVAIAIPLPLTNAIPALGITIMALGLLNRDGLIIAIGVLTSIFGLFIAAGAIIAAWVGIKFLLKAIF